MAGPISSSSSSLRMEASDRFASITTLGRRLIDQLGANDDELLSCWMSQHVARLIREAEDAAPGERRVAEERCASFILALWRERRSLREPVPFNDLDKAGQAVAKLQDRTQGWYLERATRDDHEDKLDPLLVSAITVDAAAKEIILWCVRSAVRKGLEVDKAWLEALDIKGPGAGVDHEVARRLAEMLSFLDNDDERAMVLNPFQREAERVLHRLEALNGAAQELAAALRAEVERPTQARKTRRPIDPAKKAKAKPRPKSG